MRYKLIILWLFFMGTARAQREGKALIDSLLTSLPQAATDTARARIFNKAAIYYYNVNTDSSLKYAASGMQLASRMNWYKGMAVFHTAYANIFSTRGQMDSSLKRHLMALEIFKKINDSVNLGITYNNLGTIAKEKSDFVSAAKYFTNTLAIGEDLKDYFNIGLACENLALVYQYEQDSTECLSYARHSVAAYGLSDRQDMAAGPLETIGTFYLHQKKYDSAYYYYQKSITIFRKNGNKIKEATVLNSFAEYYADQADYQNAIKYGLEAKKIWDLAGPSYEDASNTTGMIGYYYLQLARQSMAGIAPAKAPTIPLAYTTRRLLQQAGSYLQEAVYKSRANSNKTSQSEFQNSLAEVNALAGNYKDAFLNYRIAREIKDSIFSQESKNKIAKIESQKEIDLKNKEIENNQLQIGNQHKKMLLLLSSIAFLIVTGALLYRQSLTRKRTNTTLLQLNTELDEANKIKAKFFAILSHDLRSPVANLINFLQLQKKKPGLLSEEQIEDREKKIAASGESLLQTMETMLLWAKGQMDYFKPEVQIVEVDSLFAYLATTFSANENIKFIFSNPQTLKVSTDTNYLQSIMHNLTSNAVKALQKTGSAKIEWQAFQQDGKTILSISDNGPGLAQEFQHTLQHETIGANARTGLGLHLIRDLAKAIHCSITVDSAPGEGTTFRLFA